MAAANKSATPAKTGQVAYLVDGVSKWEKQKKILKMLRQEGLFKMGWDTMKALWTMK